MNKKLIRKMLTASGGPLRIKFTPEQIALFESQATRVPGMNNSGGNRYREEGVLALRHLEQEAKRKEEEIKSRMEMHPTLKRKATTAEKIRGKKDEYELVPLVVGMSGTDPVGEFILAGIGFNGIGALAKTGLWNVAKYAPTTQLGNWGRGYFVGNAFRNSFSGTVPTLTSQATSLLYQPIKLNEPGLTSLKFFEKPTLSNAQELAGAIKWERNFKPEWHVVNYPGYLLKGLMKGSLLEKQLSKNGTININLLNAYFNKASQLERDVANKVLAEKFAGQKTIDYNAFRKAVQDELITYNRVPSKQYENYGLDRLGLREREIPKGKTMPEIIDPYKDNPLFKEQWEPRKGLDGRIYYIDKVENTIFDDYTVANWILKNLAPETTKLNTFTFESPRIGLGNDAHYNHTTLGHSRTYTTVDEPDVLHVMESQSDWGQHKLNKPKFTYKRGETGNTNIAINEKGQYYVTDDDAGIPYTKFVKPISDTDKRWPFEIAKQQFLESYPEAQAKYLHDNYLQRQLQENLRYAAENGLTKMRYPTSETAAKIEGYTTKLQWYSPTGEKLDMGKLEFNPETGDFEYPKGSIMKNEYPIEHQTILKKYADFPKLFLKLFKDLKVRTVTDAKGNTWYEVDVPKGYLSREWQFKQGGKMNVLEFLKNGSGIHIKKENRGKFTDYCGGKVTSECIAKGKRSSSATIRKRATFAANVRKWKHNNGGLILFAEEGTKMNFGLRLGNFLNSDLGKTAINSGLSLFNTYSANNSLEALAQAQKVENELETANAILKAMEEYLKNRLLKFKLWMSDYLSGKTMDLPSDIVAAHLGYEDFNLLVANIKSGIKLKNTLMDMAVALAKQNNWTSSIGGLLQEGLGTLGNYLSKKNDKDIQQSNSI